MIDLDTKVPPEGDNLKGTIFFRLHPLVVTPDHLHKAMVNLARLLARRNNSSFVARMGTCPDGKGGYWVGFNHPIFARVLQGIIEGCYQDPARVQMLKKVGYRLATMRLPNGVTGLRFSEQSPQGMQPTLELILSEAEATRLYMDARKRRKKSQRSQGSGDDRPVAVFNAARRELVDSVREIDVTELRSRATQGASGLAARIIRKGGDRFGKRRPARGDSAVESE